MATIISREEAVASLYRIYEARSEKRVADDADRLLGGKVKDYMMSSGEVELHDGEAEIVAILQRRIASGSLDLARMADEAPDLLLDIARSGALKADIKALDGRADLAGAVDYMTAGGTTFALIVKEAS